MAHYSLNLASPIYCAVFLPNDRVILGGGGGSSKSGVHNKLWLIKLEPERKSHLVLQEHALPPGSDCPMSLAFDPVSGLLLSGINSSPEEFKTGSNQHFRTFSIKQSSLVPKDARQLFNFENGSDYQRIVCLSRASSPPRLLAVGGTNDQFQLLLYPSLKPATAVPVACPTGELLTADFSESGKQLLICSNKAVRIFSIKGPSKAKGPKTAKLSQLHELVPLTDGFASSFRTAKFGIGATSDMIITLLNPQDRKKGSRIISWDAKLGTIRRSRFVTTRPVTAFDISGSGKLLALGSSDLAITVLDAVSLRPILSILHAHEFPVTCLKFSPDSKRLISASADTTMRVIEIPERRSPWRSSSISILVLISLIVLFVSYLISKQSINLDQLHNIYNRLLSSSNA